MSVSMRSGARSGSRRASAKKDFFVSYTHGDTKWAEWIASVLESGKHSTVMQAWDFGPGRNFVVEMHKALQNCRRLVLVYTPAYFASVYAQAEWAAAFTGDPTGKERTLLPVRVQPCQPAGLLAPIVYCDLVGLAEKQARERLLSAAQPVLTRTLPRTVVFPGAKVARRTRCDIVRELGDILSTTLVTFGAQCRVRDRLVEAIGRRLGRPIEEEYEAFFHRHFENMTADERRQHSTIREYTRTVLRQYNSRAFELCEEVGHSLENDIESLWTLREHLTLWLAKYRTAMRRPSTCLVYVGVDEEVGFPTSIDEEVAEYLADYCGGAGRRSRRRLDRESE